MSTELIENVIYKVNYNIQIFQDDYPENPRTWDNLGEMICWHRRYTLGDKHSFQDYEAFRRELYGAEAYDNLSELYDEKIIATCHPETDRTFRERQRAELAQEFENIVEEKIQGENVILPLRLHDHSGISMSVNNIYPYNDTWDSMIVGFIYCSNEKAVQEYGNPKLTNPIEKLEDLAQARERVRTYLIGEVETYDSYLRGDIYGYNVYRGDELIDSCGGYFDKDQLLADARSACDSDERERFPLLKGL